LTDVAVSVVENTVVVSETATVPSVVVATVQGPQGPTGEGVPIGGTTGQVPQKASATDYDLSWLTLAAVATSGAYGDLSGRPTLPSGVIVGDSDTQTLTNKTVTDASFAIQDDLDNTKKVVFQCSGITTGSTLTYTFANTSGTFVVDTGSQGISGAKTFSNANQNLGSGTVASTCNVAYGATTSGFTKAVNIGTAGLSGSTTTINIGSAVSGALGTTTLNQTTVLGSTIQLKNYTVGTLPTAGTAGRRAYVTDATAPTWLGTLTGGGAVRCPVFDNGTAWVAG